MKEKKVEIRVGTAKAIQEAKNAEKRAINTVQELEQAKIRLDLLESQLSEYEHAANAKTRIEYGMT